MNIAINSEAPEYVARITLKPKTDDMKICNHYEKPLLSGNSFLFLAAISIAVGLIYGVK